MSDPTPRPSGTSRADRPPGTIRLGSFAGTEVLLTSSWFVIAILISVVLAPRVEDTQPGLGPWTYVVGVVLAVLLYLAVLLHEGSHAYVARRYGHPVRSITLSFIGGRTTVDGEAETPGQEFWTSVVGPLTSLAVGGAALGVWFALPSGGLLHLAVEVLAFANLLLGVLNLIPGLPLDGGRVLKAGVWKATGSPFRGVVVAAWGGRVTAGLLLLLPVLVEPVLGASPSLTDYILCFVLALFLWGAASAELASARLRNRLPAVVARTLARRTLTVPGDLPLAEAVRRAQEAEAGSIVTVSTAGAPVGVVSEAALLATPEDRRPWVAVSTVARTLSEGLLLPADITGAQLLKAISRSPAAEYLLLEPDGAIYGVLATTDVDRAVRAV